MGLCVQYPALNAVLSPICKVSVVRVRCSLSLNECRSLFSAVVRKFFVSKSCVSQTVSIHSGVRATSFRELDFSLSSREQHFHRSISRFVKCQTQQQRPPPHINSHSEVLTEEGLIIDSFYSFLEVATDQPLTLKGPFFLFEGEGSNVGFQSDHQYQDLGCECVQIVGTLVTAFYDMLAYT